jgi:hypothetical protein
VSTTASFARRDNTDPPSQVTSQFDSHRLPQSHGKQGVPRSTGNDARPGIRRVDQDGLVWPDLAGGGLIGFGLGARKTTFYLPGRCLLYLHITIQWTSRWR